MPSVFIERVRYLFRKAMDKALSPLDTILTYIAFRKNRQFYLELATDVTLTAEWKEIILDPPLEVKHEVQEIQLYFDGYELTTDELIELMDEDREIDYLRPTLKDGTVLDPKVRIKDEYGGKFDLEYEWRHECVCFRGTLPGDRRYVQTDIKCEPPIICEKVNWHDFTHFLK